MTRKHEVKENSELSDSFPIILNVYDLSTRNDYFYYLGLGLYHTGIEVQSNEYIFCGHPFEYTGVVELKEPKRSFERCTFRESIFLGMCDKSQEEIQRIILSLSNEYTGASYHITSRNCNHFTDELCYRLVNKRIPRWINRLATIGQAVSCLLPFNDEFFSPPISPAQDYEAMSNSSSNPTSSSLFNNVSKHSLQ